LVFLDFLYFELFIRVEFFWNLQVDF